MKKKHAEHVHPAEFHGEHPHHGHEHMKDILDGHHTKSVKHEGGAVHGIGGLAPVHKPHADTRGEVFRKGGHVKK